MHHQGFPKSLISLTFFSSRERAIRELAISKPLSTYSPQRNVNQTGAEEEKILFCTLHQRRHPLPGYLAFLLPSYFILFFLSHTEIQVLLDSNPGGLQLGFDHCPVLQIFIWWPGCLYCLHYFHIAFYLVFVLAWLYFVEKSFSHLLFSIGRTF